ncbi:hypothetical protein [Microcoleus sp. BROC3]|uniref:hypothetical protein n=1 Tax=Microcoleus sp. BROC3 TaxID=3055323 RepID=UPI002FD0CED8
MSTNSSSIDRKPADSAQKPTLSIAVPRYKTLLLTRSRLIRAATLPYGNPYGEREPLREDSFASRFFV